MDKEAIIYYQKGIIENERITKVVVQDGVRTIHYRAFEGCPKIRTVVIPNSVTSIQYWAFQGLRDLETIIIPESVKTMGQYVFNKCFSLREIVISEGLEEIDRGTFSHCHSLQRIALPKSLTKIGRSAFRDCQALEHVDIPNGVQVIDEDAFADCVSLQSIHLPNGMKIIAGRTFKGCISLHTVTFPPTIEDFGSQAFYGCKKLETFIIPHGLPVLAENFYPSFVGFDFTAWKVVKQILSNASSLKTMTIRTITNVDWEIKDDDLPKILELISACPTLREVNLFCGRNLTIGVFEKLASQDFPGHLRLLQIKDQEGREERRRVREQHWQGRKKAPLSPEHLLRLLERNPKLVIKTDKFWDDREDDKVLHQLDMNEYGCRGFTVQDSRWPELIETLNTIEKDDYDFDDKQLRTGPSNILYHMLHRHMDLFLNYPQRHKCPWLRFNGYSGYEKSLATIPLDNVDTIHRLRGRLQQQEDEIKEKDNEIIRLRRLLEQNTNSSDQNEESLIVKRARLE